MKGKSWVNLFDRYQAVQGHREKIRGVCCAQHKVGMSAWTPSLIQTLQVPGAFLQSTCWPLTIMLGENKHCLSKIHVLGFEFLGQLPGSRGVCCSYVSKSGQRDSKEV